MSTNDQPIKACTFIDKGGVGKSTLISHIGVALANDGYQTIVIDLAGKQGDIAKQFGIETPDQGDWPNISTVFQPEWEAIKDHPDFDSDPVEQMIRHTNEGVDIIPAHPGLESLDDELDNKYDDSRKFGQLNEFLGEHIDPEYDAVLIDLPGKGSNITFNGIFAAGNVITPVLAGSFEDEQADELNNELATIREKYDQPADLTMMIPNMIDNRTSLSDTYLERYGGRFGDVIAPEPVPRSQDIVNAQHEGKTIFALEDPSSTAQRAIAAIESNTEALIQRIRGVPA